MESSNFLNNLEARAKNNLIDENQERSVKDLLSENLKYSKAIYEDTQKIRRYMFIRMLINIVWLILIFTPLVFAFFYLPPAVGEFYKAYQELMGQSEGTLDLLEQLNQLK